MSTHLDYVNDYDQIELSSDYNNSRYLSEPRDCDLQLLDLVGREIGQKKNPKIIDLGCGSGHQLALLRHRYPYAQFNGRDLARSLIHRCSEDKVLDGIDFAVHDITEDYPEKDYEKFDVAVVTAVLQVLPFELQKKALGNIFKILKPGGCLINFDGYHDFEKIDCFTINIDNVISEKPPTSTMTYYYPSKKLATHYCSEVGFSNVRFVDFSMTKDLQYSPVSPPSTHTIQQVGSSRLSMLGIVSQPWTFLVATK